MCRIFTEYSLKESPQVTDGVSRAQFLFCLTFSEGVVSCFHGNDIRGPHPCRRRSVCHSVHQNHRNHHNSRRMIVHHYSVLAGYTRTRKVMRSPGISIFFTSLVRMNPHLVSGGWNYFSNACGRIDPPLTKCG